MVLLDTPILYLSGYIIKNKSEYYKRLLGVTEEGAWEEWILYFLEAIYDTSKWTMSKVFAIQKQIEETRQYVKEKALSLYNKDFIELLFTQPYIRIQNLVETLGIQRITASKKLKRLCEIGFLDEFKKGREKLYINHSLLSLLKKK